MTDKNEHIFKLLKKFLSSKGEDYLLKEKDVISFYKKNKAEISDRTARDIIKHLYPKEGQGEDKNLRRETYFSRKIVRKYILPNLARGEKLDELLDPANIEYIEKQLKNNNITLPEREDIEKLIEDEWQSSATSWSEGDFQRSINALNDVSQDLQSRTLKVEKLSAFKVEAGRNLDDEIVSGRAQLLPYGDMVLKEKQARLANYEVLSRQIGMVAKNFGGKKFMEKIGEYHAEVSISRMRVSLDDEDQSYLEAQIAVMRFSTNEWTWEVRMFLFRTIILKGGRGGAKTTEVAQILIDLALNEKNSIFLCIRETKNAIKDSSLSALKEVIDRFDLSRFFAITNNTLRCTFTNSTFVFRGTHNAENAIKSIANIKYVWCDEAHTYPLEFWRVLDPTIRRDDAKIFITYNPKSEKDPVHTYYLENQADTVKAMTVNLEDNEFAPQSLKNLREHHRRTMNPDDFKHIWEGQFLKYSDALVFKGKFVVEAVPAPPAGTQFYYGMDLGEKDPTAIVRVWVRYLTEEEDWELIVDRCFYMVGATQKDIADGIKGILEDDPEGVILCDHNEQKTVNQIRSDYGFRLIRASKGKDSISGGIRRLKGFKRIVIGTTDEMKPVQDEFETYKYKVDPRTEEIGTVPEDKNNHAIDALRYAISNFRDEHPTTEKRDNSAIWQNAFRN